MWIYFILIWILPHNLYAANPYKLGDVDYFKDSLLSPSKEEHKTLDWQEPFLNAEGKINFYTPPIAVANLLESPTDANAKAYLNWQKLKMQRIIKAQEAIDQAIKESHEQ